MTKSVQPKSYVEEDVINERVDHLIEHRIPWLLLGILGGIFATLVVSSYEAMLSLDVRLAFFIPVIVYLSDAIGTQTESIYVRELSERKNMDFTKYILKETAVGFGLGMISGTLLGFFAAYWLASSVIGFAIGVTMVINLTLAPLLAIFIPNFLYQRHTDPALGSGPIATIVQDLISLLIYFFVVSLVVF